MVDLVITYRCFANRPNDQSNNDHLSNLPTNLQTNQPTNKPTSHLATKPTYQLINQPTHQSAIYPASQPASQPTDQCKYKTKCIIMLYIMYRSTSKPINKLNKIKSIDPNPFLIALHLYLSNSARLHHPPLYNLTDRSETHVPTSITDKLTNRS